jgi:AcrR family transcriptional regulator
MSRTETIKAQAVRMIASDGFEGMSLRALAGACGLQPGSIYAHYSSKQQLLVEVLIEYLEDLLHEWRLQSSSRRSPVRQIQVFIEVYVRFQSVRLDEQRILQWDRRSLESDARQRVQSLMDEYRDELVLILRAGHEKGLLFIEDVVTSARLFVGLMVGMSVQAELDGVSSGHLTVLLWRCVQGMTGVASVGHPESVRSVTA